MNVIINHCRCSCDLYNPVLNKMEHKWILQNGQFVKDPNSWVYHTNCVYRNMCDIILRGALENKFGGLNVRY